MAGVTVANMAQDLVEKYRRQAEAVLRAAHECKPPRTCVCYALALEPSEDCPVHGYPWPPRCGDCGRFMLWKAP